VRGQRGKKEVKGQTYKVAQKRRSGKEKEGRKGVEETQFKKRDE
jgi:hypothetical protein